MSDTLKAANCTHILDKTSRCRLQTKAPHRARKIVSHYENTPMQNTAIFHGCKDDNFQLIFFYYFHIFAQNTYSTVRGFFHQPAHSRGEGATIKRISPPRKPPAGGDCGGSAAFPRWVLQIKIDRQSLPVFKFSCLRRGSAGG